MSDDTKKEQENCADNSKHYLLIATWKDSNGTYSHRDISMTAATPEECYDYLVDSYSYWNTGPAENWGRIDGQYTRVILYEVSGYIDEDRWNDYREKRQYERFDEIAAETRQRDMREFKRILHKYGMSSLDMLSMAVKDEENE